MKKTIILAMAFAFFLGGVSLAPLSAEERGDWSMTVGADAVSSYLWRGMSLAGPSIQPSAYFDYERGDWAVSLGVWGTKSLLKDDYDELDFSVEASWRNLTLTAINYGENYTVPWQEGHYLDLGLSYTLSEDVPVTFSWYSIVNQAGAPSYFEVAYDFSVSVVDFSVTMGGIPFASEYYESDAFGISNLSLMVGHEFEFEHGGTLPVSAQVMYNPMAKGFFWGVSVGYYFSLDL
jgi:hypothetical protein